MLVTVCHEQEQVMQPDFCVTARPMGARTPGIRLQERVSNHLWLLWSKAMVVSAKGKGPARPGQMGDRKLNGSESPMKCRKRTDEVKTAGESLLRDKLWRSLFMARAASGMKVTGTCCRRLSGTWEPSAPMRTEKLKRKPRKSLSRNAARRGGTPRSSGEVPDKGMEQRGRSYEGWSIKPTGNGRSL